MTSTELGYLSGVTSNIQDQLNGKAPSSHGHNLLVEPFESKNPVGIQYSGSGVTTASWLCAFDTTTYSGKILIQAISPSNMRTVIGAAEEGHTHTQLTDYYEPTQVFLPSYNTAEYSSGEWIAIWDNGDAGINKLRAIHKNTLLSSVVRYNDNGAIIANTSYGVITTGSDNNTYYLTYLSDDYNGNIGICVGYNNMCPIKIGGPMVVSNVNYGTSLPSSGKSGQVFYLKS